jgi:hypothetical protein
MKKYEDMEKRKEAEKENLKTGDEADSDEKDTTTEDVGDETGDASTK